jgi:bifunctional UDP-N-acetylglucosamine pyrophosphorylase/glucosamine-1-phosphate N-acetyltransferase
MSKSRDAMSIYHNLPLTTIILAAGKGTRMKSTLPKVLHAIAGKAMIRHVIDSALPLQPKQNIIVIHPEMENYRSTIKKEKEPIDFATQTQPLGTADAVKIGLKQNKASHSRVLILYGDTPLITTQTLERLLRLDTDIALLAFERTDPTGYGRVIIKKNDFIDRIVEEKDASKSERAITLCNSGILTVSSQLLLELLDEVQPNNAAGEYYLTDIISIANEKGKDCRYVLCQEEELVGVNTRAQLATANAIFQKRKANEAMANGTTLVAPETVFFSYDTRLGIDVIIHPYVTFGPKVEIGNNSVIHSFSHIEGAIIGNHCSIGPFARIRPDTIVASEAKIGNFVEIKKSIIGKASKINHLTYIGDAELKEDVNVGAGVVTCNYDGFQKSMTKIGKHVFVGSNSSLVAPITVGDNAIIGAGSTVLEDIPNDAMALSKVKQTNIPEGAKRFKEKKTNS